MNKIDSMLYKDFLIEVFYNKETKAFSAHSVIGNSHCEYDSKRKNFCHGHENPTDAFTDVLRKFQRAVMKVHLAFMKTLMPVFKDLAKEFKIAMVPQMINAFGKQLQELTRDAIPFIKNFISNLSSDEGMTYIGQAFGIMFTGLKFYLQ